MEKGKMIINGVEVGGSFGSATSVPYSNTNSGLEATNVQGAIDELNSNLTNENSETFNFGIKDGVRGFFTDPSRADDCFIPFKRGLLEKISYVFYGFSCWITAGKTLYASGYNLLDGSGNFAYGVNNNNTAASKEYTLSGIGTITAYYGTSTGTAEIRFKPSINCKGIITTIKMDIEATEPTEVEFVAGTTYKYSASTVFILIE